MRVRWTTDAADDLERICDYIAEDRPETARRVAQSVVERIGTLKTFPNLGRVGRVQGTREIVFPPLPFVGHLRSSRGADRRLANPPRSAALAERALGFTMLPRITITRTWSDNDVAQLTIEVCDGVSVFTNEAYASLEWGATAATALRTFGRHIHGGLFDLEAGDEGPEYASGSFRARFHYYKPNQLLISTIQQGDFFSFKGSQEAPTATMFLRTEPSLLDQFVAALPALDAPDGGQAVLQCVPLPDNA